MLDHPLYRRDPMTPQSLVLELLLAHGERPLSVGQLLAAAGLFGISANHVRVTLARLTAAHMVQAPRRGQYTLGEASRQLAFDVAQWRQARQRLRPWDGSFVAVYGGPAAGADKGIQQRHARALQLLGFAPWGAALHLRPNNLEPNLHALRQRLYTVGLHPDCRVFRTDDFADTDQAHLLQLWDGTALTHGYRHTSTQLAQWLQQAHSRDLAQAARESLVLGRAAIRQLIFDPLLPNPLVDETARNQFMDTALAFDTQGQAIWQQFLATATPLADAPT